MGRGSAAASTAASVSLNPRDSQALFPDPKNLPLLSSFLQLHWELKLSCSCGGIISKGPV